MDPAFLVFDEQEWQVATPAGGASGWAEFPHAESRQRGFILVPGASILSPAFEVDADHCVLGEFIRATEPVSADGLDLVLALLTPEGRAPLLAVQLDNSVRRNVPRIARIDLRAFEGMQVRLELSCGPGPAGNASADWAGVVCLAVATVDKLSLASARSQYAWRMSNEAGHFTDAYAAALYAPTGSAAEGTPTDMGAPTVRAAKNPPGWKIERRPDEQLRVLEAIPPQPGESPFAYAARLLAQVTPGAHIDFAARLAELREGRESIRLLSLCSGAARVEEMILKSASMPVEVTLLDVNEALLQQAAARMPAGTAVRCIRGRAEDLRAVAEGPYDVACFVSGLHHVVELEAVLDDLRSVLAHDGELWLIGEQLGRNGNRMWPDARRAAERVFESLPRRLRFNRNTQRVDDRLPDLDFGSSGFEGVRSEDLQQAVGRYYVPIRETVRNCFMWRLIDLAYIENYDIGRPEDVHALRRLVAEEFAFYANGGIGCELNGIYRDKLRVH